MWLSSVPMTHPTFAAYRSRWEDGAWTHTRVMGLFGDLGGAADARAAAGVPSGVLYRVEPGIGRGRVLVQSPVRPTADVTTRPGDAFLALLEAGDPISFCVRLNAITTVNRTGADGWTRQSRQPVPQDDQLEWALGKLSALTEVGVLGCQQATARFGKVPLNTVTVQGRAVVADPDALRALVSAGVGRAKAYGCGLLSVLPEA